MDIETSIGESRKWEINLYHNKMPGRPLTMFTLCVLWTSAGQQQKKLSICLFVNSKSLTKSFLNLSPSHKFIVPILIGMMIQISFSLKLFHRLFKSFKDLKAKKWNVMRLIGLLEGTFYFYSLYH